MCQNSQISAASHHDAGLTIILPRRCFNHRASFRGGSSAQLLEESFDALIAGREAVAIDQILPDRHRVAAARKRQLDYFEVGFARAGGWAAIRPRFRRDHFFAGRPRAKVGGHLVGRFCHPATPAARWPYRDSCRFQISGGSLAPDVDRSLDAPQRPAQLPQRNDLLFLLFAQDIHSTEGNPPVTECPGSARPLAGFQVTLIGRLWMIPEASVTLRHLDPCTRLLRLLRGLFGFRMYPLLETGHDRAERPVRHK